MATSSVAAFASAPAQKVTVAKAATRWMSFIIIRCCAVGARPALLSNGPPAFPPDCVTDRLHTPGSTTRLIVGRLLLRARRKSIRRHRFSGEPFRFRDIQFAHPEVGIAVSALVQIGGALGVIGECAGSGREQRGLSVGAEAAFEEARIGAAIDEQQQ